MTFLGSLEYPVVLSTLSSQNSNVCQFWKNSENCTAYSSQPYGLHPMHVLFSFQQHTQVGNLDFWRLSLNSPSSFVFCPTISSCLSLPLNWICLLNSKYHHLLLETPLYAVYSESTSQQTVGMIIVLSSFVFPPTGIRVLYCLYSKQNIVVVHFTQFSTCLQWRGKFSISYSILAKVDISNLSFLPHPIPCSVNTKQLLPYFVKQFLVS